MSQLSINLFHISSNEWLNTLRNDVPNCSYDFNKHQILLQNESGNNLGYVRLPLHLQVTQDLKITENENPILYLSIESGNAAICVMQGESNSYHTTFSAYMSRKKQGVSQIKYLNKKGKSRAGSRVRLAKTLEFFENINSALTKLFNEYPFDRIAISCSATLIPYLHQSKVSCPFEKKDTRLYKIPIHLPQSNYTNLDKAIKKLKAPVLFYEVNDADYFKSFNQLK